MAEYRAQTEPAAVAKGLAWSNKSAQTQKYGLAFKLTMLG